MALTSGRQKTRRCQRIRKTGWPRSRPNTSRRRASRQTADTDTSALRNDWVVPLTGPLFGARPRVRQVKARGIGRKRRRGGGVGGRDEVLEVSAGGANRFCVWPLRNVGGCG